MEPKFQTSFIPKGPIASTPSASSRSLTSSRPVSLIPLLATIAFTLSLLAAGGIFVYEKVLVNQIAAANTALVQAKASFDPQTMAAILAASDRISATRTLLNNHSAVSGFFALLEQNVLPKVSLSSLTFTADTPTTIKFSAAGTAESYSVAAEQGEIFAKMPFINNQNFSGLDLNDKGQVGIKFEGVIDRSLVSYEHVLGQSTQTP